MEQRTIQTGKFKFSTDSNLLFEFGERLVTKSSIALAELVKNAYDADATKVSVTFDKIGKPDGIILIEDDGHGMTFEQIENHWMRLGTGEKRIKLVSPRYCRPLTGEKGVGRLAVQRLGTRLILQSIAARYDNGSQIKERVNVEFDWHVTFSPGQDLSTISISYTRQVVPADTKTGVSLLIEKVKDKWTRKELDNLRRDILSVQSPFNEWMLKTRRSESQDCEPDPGFNIELLIEGSDELKDFEGELGEVIFNDAWAKLEGYVDEKGYAHYDILMQRTGKIDTLVDASKLYVGLEGARFRIYYFVNTKSRKGKDTRGVRIYLDSFRVFPYGDPQDDWLQLDEYNSKNTNIAKAILPAKEVQEQAGGLDRPYLHLPRNNQVFGAVLISQAAHTGIEMNVTRDRLIQTDTFDRLRLFAQSGIYWMTVKYSAYLVEQQTLGRTELAKTQDKRGGKKESHRAIIDIIEEVKSVVTNQTEIPQAQRLTLLEHLNIASEDAQRREEERISDISMLRILASAGTTLGLMNNQLQAIVNAIAQIQRDLELLRPNIPTTVSVQYSSIIEQVSDWQTMVRSQVSMFGFLLSSDSRQHRKKHLLYSIVEDVKRPLSLYMKDFHITFDNDVSQALRTPPMYTSELYAILINIFSNALKAVSRQSERRICVRAERIGKNLYIWMLDTGIGVPPERRERVFKPFETTSIPDPILGIGTGLGLGIVRDLLETYHGSAHFIDCESPWKTCLELILPERETPSNRSGSIH